MRLEFKAKNNSDQPVHWLIFLLLIVLLFMSEHSLFFIQKDPVSDASQVGQTIQEGNVDRQAAFLLLGLVGLVFLLKENRRLVIDGFLGRGILFYLTWCLFTVAWSGDIQFTARKLVVLVLLCVAAIGIVRKFSAREIMLFTLYSTSVYLFLGIVVEIFLGHQNVGNMTRFSGTIHPHLQSINCGLLCIAALSFRTSGERHPVTLTALSMISIAFLILTKDRTSFASLSLILVFFFLLRLAHFEKRVIFLCAILGICTFGALVGDSFFFGSQNPFLLGRGGEEGVETLTGRTELWRLSLEYAKANSFLGYGYDSFWTPVRAETFTKILGWPISEAHSSYVEILLDCGIVGLLLFVMIFVFALRKLIVLLRSSRNQEAAFPIFGVMVIFFYLLTGITSSTSPRPTFIGFLVFLILARLAFIEPNSLTRSS